MARFSGLGSFCPLRFPKWRSSQEVAFCSRNSLNWTAGRVDSYDGTVFVDQQNNTLDVIKINPAGGPVQRVARAESYFLRSHTVELPDGRVIVPGLVSGRPRLMLTKANKLATSL